MKTRTNTHLSLAFILSSFLLSGCEKEEIVDLISNGNVDKGLVYPYDWWSNDRDGKYKTQWTQLEYFSPKKSLAISTDTAYYIDYAFWAQSITDNLPHGKAVTLKVKIMAELDSGSGITLVIRGDDTDSPPGGGQQYVSSRGKHIIRGTFDWTDYSITLDNVDATIDRLMVYLVYKENRASQN